MKQDKVLWFAIVFSTVIYAVIIYTLHPRPEGSFEAAARQQMTLILYGLTIVSFVFALIVPGRISGPPRLKMIIGLGLFESCAIYGLLAAMLARDWRLFIPTWIVALLGMWRHYPSAENEQLPS